MLSVSQKLFFHKTRYYCQQPSSFSCFRQYLNKRVLYVIRTIKKRVQEVVQVHAECELAISRLKVQLTQQKCLNGKLRGQIQIQSNLIKKYRLHISKSKEQYVNLSGQLFLAKIQLERLRLNFNSLLESFNKLTTSTISKDLSEQFQRKLKQTNLNWQDRLTTQKLNFQGQLVSLRNQNQNQNKGLRRQLQFVNKLQNKQISQRYLKLRFILQGAETQQKNLNKQKKILTSHLESSLKQKLQLDECYKKKILSMGKDYDKGRKEYDQQILKYKKLLNKQIQNNKNLQLQNDSSKKQVIKLKQIIGIKKLQLDRLIVKVQAQQCSKKKTIQQLNKSSQEKQIQQKQIINLRSQNQSLKAKIKHLELLNQQLLRKIRQLQQQVGQLSFKQNKLSKQFSIIKPQVQKMKSNNQKFQNALKIKDQSIQQLKDKISKKEQENQKINALKQQMIIENQDLKRQIQLINKKIHNEKQLFQKRIQNLKNTYEYQIQQLRRFLNQKDKQLREQLNVINKYQQEIENLKKLLLQRQKQIMQKNNQANRIPGLIDTINQLQNTIRTSKKNNQQLKNKQAIEIKNRQNLQDKIKFGQIQLRTSQQSLKRLQKQILQLKQRLRGLKGQLDIKDAALIDQINKAQSKQLQSKNLKTKNQLLQSQIAQLLKSLNLLNKQINSSPQQLNKLKKLLFQYAKRLIFFQKQLQSINQLYNKKTCQLIQIRTQYNQTGIQQLNCQIFRLRNQITIKSQQELTLSSKFKEIQLQNQCLKAQLKAKEYHLNQISKLQNHQAHYQSRKSLAQKQAANYIIRLKELQQRRFYNPHQQEFRARMIKSRNLRIEQLNKISYEFHKDL